MGAPRTALPDISAKAQKSRVLSLPNGHLAFTFPAIFPIFASLFWATNAYFATPAA